MNKITFILIFLIFTISLKSQNNCYFIEKVQNYQESIRLKNIEGYSVIDSATFDFNTYISLFDEIDIDNNYTVGVYFFDGGMEGFPYLYALKEVDYLNNKSQEAIFDFFKNDSETGLKKHIIPKNSENSFLQYLFLCEFGDQFALKWHSAYNKARIICSKEQLKSVIINLENSQDFLTDSIELGKMKEISPEIEIENNDSCYNITWLEYITHFGIYRCTYSIEKAKPYKVERIKEEKLLNIKMNFRY